MTELFITILNMSISATWIVLAVVVLRFLLKKAPKWITVLLWGIVAIRLLCPVTVESVVSLIPSAETVSRSVMQEPAPQVHTGIAALNMAVNPVIQETKVEVVPSEPVNILHVLTPIFTGIWLAGMGVMLLYTVFSYWWVKKMIGTAVRLRDNIYQSERVVSPFVLGLVKPRIYLPFAVGERDMPHVLAHEQAHIRRRDYLWKPLGFLLLTVHWFNPLLWLGYILLCRDIELACDEKVVKNLDREQRADYSQALLACSVNRRVIAACPLAFGEGTVQNRVKSVLNYKKPAFWIILIALVAIIITAVCFLTNPKKPDKEETPPTQTDSPNTEQVARVVVPAEVQQLMAKYPECFGLDTTKGLEVYIWQMAEGSYSCGLLPGRNRNYTRQELLNLHKTSASIEEMQVIVLSYIPDVPKSGITIIPIAMPHSSYAYQIDEAYAQRLNERFWSNFPVLAAYSYSPIIDSATFDIDGDGKEESCTLGYGPTSGLFTVILRAQENGKDEYFNIFMLAHGELSFVKTDAGWRLKLIPSLGDLEIIYYSFSVRDGNIVLTHNGEEAFYWGEQGMGTVWSGIQMDENSNILSAGSYPEYVTVYEETPTEQVGETYDKGEIVIHKTHYQDIDGSWVCNGYGYLFRLELTGRMHASEKNITYIILANRKDITFDDAWKAGGLSSNLNDYFTPEDAVIVGTKLF